MKLKELRTKKGYTMQNMADKLGITSSGYSRIETQKYTINIKMLVRLAEILECTTDEILGYNLQDVLKRNEEYYKNLMNK